MTSGNTLKFRYLHTFCLFEPQERTSVVPRKHQVVAAVLPKNVRPGLVSRPALNPLIPELIICWRYSSHHKHASLLFLRDLHVLTAAGTCDVTLGLMPVQSAFLSVSCSLIPGDVPGMDLMLHRGQCAVCQEDLHGLVGAPCDGSCRHMKHDSRPDARPESLLAFRPSNVPDGVYLHSQGRQSSRCDMTDDTSDTIHHSDIHCMAADTA